MSLPAAADQSTPQILAGVTVVELGSRVGASVCGSLLAQLGATVICVEYPTDRRADTKWRLRTQLVAGKLSFVPGDRDAALLAQLVAASGIIITSSDVDPAGVAPRFPDDAIVCDVTAFGSTGPQSGMAWSDAQIQAVSGVMDSTGLESGAPTPIGIPLVEQVSGIYAAGAVLAALRLRRRQGVGQSIEIALYDVAFSLMTSFLPVLLAGTPHARVSRVGNRQTMVAPWNVFRADDGWILLCAGSDEQWRRICEVIGSPDLGEHPDFVTAAERLARVGAVDGIVGEWVARRTVAECVQHFTEAAIACGPIAPIDSYPREANLLHRNMIHQLRDELAGHDVYIPGSPLHMSRSPGSAPQSIPLPGDDRTAVEALVLSLPTPSHSGERSRGTFQKPLTGIRVVEIGHYTTAPLAARHLANLGAEVIKIEPPGGEPVRGWPPAKSGQGIFFTFQNADKKSVVLDIGTEAGREKLKDLLAVSDVLIENLKPGALAKRGLTPDAILGINPGIVYCGVSGFGDDSLYAARPAFDAVIQATSGLMDVVKAEGTPLKTGPSSADVMGAVTAFAAIVAALEFRDRTGHGQHLDLSMQDIGAWATQAAWNRAGDTAAHTVTIKCKDGYVAVEAKDAASAVDRPDLLTRGELADRLARHGFRAAPVLNIEEVIEADQTTARRLWFMADEGDVSYPLLASPLRLHVTPAIVAKPGPQLGRDTESILNALPARPSRRALPT